MNINYLIKTRLLQCLQDASQCLNVWMDVTVQCSMGNEHTFIDFLAYLIRPITHNPKESLE